MQLWLRRQFRMFDTAPSGRSSDVQLGVRWVRGVYRRLGARRPLLGWGSMVSKNRCVTGAVQPLPIPRGVYAIADALHLFWILGADVLILGWSGSHCTPHAIRIGQLWGAYSFLCFAILSGPPSTWILFGALSSPELLHPLCSRWCRDHRRPYPRLGALVTCIHLFVAYVLATNPFFLA